MKKWLAGTCLFLALPLAALAAGPPSQIVGVGAAPTNGSTPFHLISAATRNATSVKATNGTVYSLTAINTTSTLYYLKFYDVAGAPTCNTDAVKLTFPIPANAGNGSGVTTNFVPGFDFGTGIGICLVAGINDNDNTVAATGVAIDLGYK